MADVPDSERKAAGLGFLGEIKRLKRRRGAGRGLEPGHARLRAWQMRRLARTYADLLEHPRFAPACRFFLDEIYAPKDFSRRDDDMRQMHALMRRFVPEPVLKPLTLTVELHALTEALDDALLAVLTGQLGVTDRITIAQYGAAYRLCDNYADRVRQIDWIVAVGLELDRIVRLPLTGTALAVARRPARSAGWEELAAFLDSGYKAFKHMRGARGFVDLIRKREMDALDRLYAADPDPYGFGATVEEP